MAYANQIHTIHTQIHLSHNTHKNRWKNRVITTSKFEWYSYKNTRQTVWNNKNLLVSIYHFNSVDFLLILLFASIILIYLNFYYFLFICCCCCIYFTCAQTHIISIQLSMISLFKVYSIYTRASPFAVSSDSVWSVKCSHIIHEFLREELFMVYSYQWESS